VDQRTFMGALDMGVEHDHDLDLDHTYHYSEEGSGALVPGTFLFTRSKMECVQVDWCRPFLL
jgi:hypothetical protein